MKYPALLLLLLLFISKISAQSGVEITRGVKKIDIPFEYRSHLPVVSVIFNRVFHLKFIFDTGAEHTILSRREITDMLGVLYEREFKMVGSDMSADLTAHLVRNIHLQISDMLLPRHNLLVLDEDYFKFDELSGVQIHGILGADVFRGFVVKINYERNIITLTRSDAFEPPGKEYAAIPIEIFRNKPYLFTDLKPQQDSTLRVKLLIDTGAALTLLLNTETHPLLTRPPNTIKGNIGYGLGGHLEGFLGRVTRLHFANYQLDEVLTYFQELPRQLDSVALNGRNGILGNQVLNRFHLIIDYPRELLYVQPNRHYDDEFEFDKSGLVVIASGENLNHFIVIDVIAGSPAAEAGIQKGDELKRINLLPANFYSLEDLNRIFRKKEGKRIKLIVIRGGQRLKFLFRLRKLI
jgi:hypothetical protein